MIQVAETNEAIWITIQIPADLLNNDPTILREYKIAHLHNGKIDYLDTLYNEEKGTLSFQTDRFSTYAIAYYDKSNATISSQGLTSPQTGDSKNPFFVMIGMLCAGTGFVLLGIKYKRK